MRRHWECVAREGVCAQLSCPSCLLCLFCGWGHCVWLRSQTRSGFPPGPLSSPRESVITRTTAVCRPATCVWQDGSRACALTILPGKYADYGTLSFGVFGVPHMVSLESDRSAPALACLREPEAETVTAASEAPAASDRSRTCLFWRRGAILLIDTFGPRDRCLASAILEITAGGAFGKRTLDQVKPLAAPDRSRTCLCERPCAIL